MCVRAFRESAGMCVCSLSLKSETETETGRNVLGRRDKQRKECRRHESRQVHPGSWIHPRASRKHGKKYPENVLIKLLNQKRLERKHRVKRKDRC